VVETSLTHNKWAGMPALQMARSVAKYPEYYNGVNCDAVKFTREHQLWLYRGVETAPSADDTVRSTPREYNGWPYLFETSNGGTELHIPAIKNPWGEGVLVIMHPVDMKTHVYPSNQLGDQITLDDVSNADINRNLSIWSSPPHETGTDWQLDWWWFNGRYRRRQGPWKKHFNTTLMSAIGILPRAKVWLMPARWVNGDLFMISSGLAGFDDRIGAYYTVEDALRQDMTNIWPKPPNRTFAQQFALSTVYPDYPDL
jgi:hypothetical protein